MFLEELKGLLRDFEKLESLRDKVETAVDWIVDSIRSGGKILIFGNGGSAADAQHFAAELVNRFIRDRRPLPALALTTDTSVLTSIANDYGFELVFKKQIEALGRREDVAFGISTSGRSRNVLEALKEARSIGMRTIGLTGKGGGDMAGLVDLLIDVPSSNTPRVQEMHLFIYHYISLRVEEAFAPV